MYLVSHSLAHHSTYTLHGVLGSMEHRCYLQKTVIFRELYLFIFLYILKKECLHECLSDTLYTHTPSLRTYHSMLKSCGCSIYSKSIDSLTGRI